MPRGLREPPCTAVAYVGSDPGSVPPECLVITFESTSTRNEFEEKPQAWHGAVTGPQQRPCKLTISSGCCASKPPAPSRVHYLVPAIYAGLTADRRRQLHAALSVLLADRRALAAAGCPRLP